MAVPQGGFNWNTATVSDFLEAAAVMTPQELVAALRDMRQATGLAFPLVAALTGNFQGSTVSTGAPRDLTVEANGALLVSPVATAGQHALTGVGSTASSGLMQMGGVDGAGVARIPLLDSAGVLAVGPPGAKLVSANANGSAASVSLAAPGAGLRLVVLSLGLMVACGANALAVSASVITGLGLPPIQVNCPVNDNRKVSIDAPVAAAINTGVSFALPALPAGAQASGWIAAMVVGA